MKIKNLFIPFLTILIFFLLVIEQQTIFFSIIIICYVLIVPGFLVLGFFSFSTSLDSIEKICLSIFVSIIYLTLTSVFINYFWILNRWRLFLFLNIPLLIYLIVYKKSHIFYLIKKKPQYVSTKNITLIIGILISCVLSALIHSTASLTHNYPLGFDTYRLHIIRINYIIENGKLLLGDLITPDFLNPFRYQWGFHLFIGSIGIMSIQNSIFMLKIIPLILSLVLPIAIYTASPLFGLKNPRIKLLSCVIAPLFLFDSTIHGLVYPFPSSLALILFIIVLRILYEINQGNHHFIILLILLIPTFFFVYKGLGVIVFFITAVCLPILLANFNIKNKKSQTFFIKHKELVMFITVIFSVFLTINIGIFLEISSSESITTFFNEYLILLKSSLIFNLNILHFYKIAGVISSALFLISIFVVRYKFLKTKNQNNAVVIILLISLIILSSGYFLGERWLLYLLPLMIFFNTLFIKWILSTKPVKRIILVFKNEKRFFNQKNMRMFITSLFIGFIFIETSIYHINPPYALGPSFGEKEEDLYDEIEKLPNGSDIFTGYTMNRYLNTFAIEKTLLYTENKSLIHFYEISKRDYYIILDQRDYSIIYDKTSNNFVFIGITRQDFPENFDNFISLANMTIYNDNSSAILKIFI